MWTVYDHNQHSKLSDNKSNHKILSWSCGNKGTFGGHSKRGTDIRQTHTQGCVLLVALQLIPIYFQIHSEYIISNIFEIMLIKSLKHNFVNSFNKMGIQYIPSTPWLALNITEIT
jgi:hypothetical protein